MSVSQQSAVDTAMTGLLTGMRAQSLQPLWQLYEQVVLREPQGTEHSHQWRWSELDRLVAQSTAAVTGELADHRVLLLTHPAFKGRIATTANLLAGIQCVLPGECTVPHRHTASAVRFVIESAGAITFVDGKACPMHRGDLVLTPNWTWHAHANETEARAVWIDMLDVPLMGLLGSTFGARGPAASFPHSTATITDEAFAHGGLVPVTDHTPVAYSPKVRWARDAVLEALKHTPPRSDGSRLLRYTNPVQGGAVLPTIDVYALELQRGQQTIPFRSSGGAFCVVMDGEGESRVGDIEHRWQPNDLFTLPNWTTRTHRATSDVARLLIVSDYELYRRAGLLRDEHLA